jgi:hypothetical protein
MVDTGLGIDRAPRTHHCGWGCFDVGVSGWEMYTYIQLLCHHITASILGVGGRPVAYIPRGTAPSSPTLSYCLSSSAVSALGLVAGSVLLFLALSPVLFSLGLWCGV